MKNFLSSKLFMVWVALCIMLIALPAQAKEKKGKKIKCEKQVEETNFADTFEEYRSSDSCVNKVKKKFRLHKIKRKLRLHKIKKSNPKLFVKILNEDMHLGDLKSVRKLFRKELKKPVNLRPMVNLIFHSIKKKHPAIVDFLCEALDKDLIPDVDKKNKVLVKMVHHIYLLNKITIGMANSPEFMIEVQDHMLATREALGIRSGFMDSVHDLYALTGELFEPIKTKTMDWVFTEYSRLRENGEILPEEIAARQNSFKFNILEASIAGNMNGFNDNAMAGIALAINPFTSASVVGKSCFIEYELSQEYVSLYETWNLAFITGNLSHLDSLYPKLLIPCVINAKPKDYLFNRALSLWVSLNIHIYAQLEEKPDHIVPNAEELSFLWGKINHEYAQNYVEKTNGTELTNFTHLLGMTYDTLWGQLKMLLLGSDVITPEEADELSELLSQ